MLNTNKNIGLLSVTLSIEQVYDEKVSLWVVSFTNFHCSAAGKTLGEAKRNLVQVFHTMLRDREVLT